MRRGLAACIALLGVALPAPASASEDRFEVESGGFFHSLSDAQPDFAGQRSLVRWRPDTRFTGQLELVSAWRGSDFGQLAGLAGWVDWTPWLFTLTSVSGSVDADYFARWRVDHEFHWKVPRLEGLVLAAGGGFAAFDDSEVGIWSLGSSWYSPWPGAPVFSYRFTRFDNEYTNQNSGGHGNFHQAQVMVGRDTGPLGQLMLSYVHGDDLVRDFVVATGQDRLFRTDQAQLGGRRFWTDRFGTDLSVAGGVKNDESRQVGFELRLVWRLGSRAPRPEPTGDE